MTESTGERNPVDLLAEEFTAAIRRGDDPTVSDYENRHPDLAGEIRTLFPTLKNLEKYKPDTADLVGTSSPLMAPGDPDRVGKFRILQRIGAGGMGTVYQAEEETLRRIVALKLLPPQALTDSRQQQLFQQEARTAARLHHSNIVPVFEAGMANGRHYIAMQFIAGHPLSDVIEEIRRMKTEPAHSQKCEAPTALTNCLAFYFGESESTRSLSSVRGQANPTDVEPHPETTHDTRERVTATQIYRTFEDGPNYYKKVAQIVANVSDAIHYAHRAGVLHRDIKPANLLLDRGGTVWVTDFGLAKSTDDDNVAKSRNTGGTLQYMAPEQLAGQGDQRSEIYSLGLTFFEMITLRPAYSATNRAELNRQVRDARPPSPRSIDSKIPLDLESIFRRATAREPEKRYQSAKALAEDLRRFAEDRPVQARQSTNAERAQRWCRRNRALTGALVAVLIVLVIGTVVSSIFAFQSAERADDASQARDIAKTRLAETTEARGLSDLNLATAMNWVIERDIQLQELGRAVRNLDQVLGNVESNWDWGFRYRHAELNRGVCKVLKCGGEIRAMAAFPAESQNQIAFGTTNGLTILTRAGDLIQQPSESAIRSIAISRDGNLVATGDREGNLCLWDGPTWKRRNSMPDRLEKDGQNTAIVSLAFSEDSKRIAVGSGLYPVPGTVCILDLPHDKEGLMKDRKELATNIQSGHLALDRKGRLAFAKGTDLYLCSSHEPEAPQQLVGKHSQPVSCIAFSPDGSQIASGGQDFELRLWDTNNRQWKSLKGHSDRIQTIVFSPEGKLLASAGDDGTIRLWNTETGKQMHTMGHGGKVFALVFADNGVLVSAGETGAVKYWDIKVVQRAIPSIQYEKPACFVAYRNGELITVSHDGYVRLHDLDNLIVEKWTSAYVEAPTCAALSPDGSLLAIGCSRRPDGKREQDGVVVLYDLVGKRVITEFEAHHERVHIVAFSPNGKLVASAGKDNYVKVRDLSGKSCKELVTNNGSIFSLAFSPSGDNLAVGGMKRAVNIYSTETWESRFTLTGHLAAVHALIFSADGDSLYSGDNSGVVKTWHVADGKAKGGDIRTGSCVNAFGVLEGNLICGNRDGSIRILESSTRKVRTTLRCHQDEVLSMDYYPQRQLLISAARGSIRLWQASTPQQILSLGLSE